MYTRNERQMYSFPEIIDIFEDHFTPGFHLYEMIELFGSDRKNEICILR